MVLTKPQSHSTFQSHRPSRHLLHAGLHAPNPFPALLGGEPTAVPAVFVPSLGFLVGHHYVASHSAPGDAYSVSPSPKPSGSSRILVCVSKGAIAPRGTCCVASVPLRLIKSVPCMSGGTTHHAGRHPRPFHALPPASGRSASRENAKKQNPSTLQSLEQESCPSHFGRGSNIGTSEKAGPKKTILLKKVSKPRIIHPGMLEKLWTIPGVVSV